jgi:hypothetical protein
MKKQRSGDTTQLLLFGAGPAEEQGAQLLSVQSSGVPQQELHPNRHHIHVDVHYVDGTQALLCTARALDPEELQRPTTEVRFVGAVSESTCCSLCNPGQSGEAPAPDLTVNDLTVFSLVNIKGVRDRARRVWLRIWAESHDCPEEHLMYSENEGYYQVPFWPVSKACLLSRIKHGSGFLVYSLFIHCLGLRLSACLREAIARGEIGAPSVHDDDEEEF